MTGAAPLTQHRGPPDTVWRAANDLSFLRLVKMLAASVVLHLLLTSGPTLLGLLGLLPALELRDQSRDLIEVELTALPVAAPGPEPHRPEETAERPEVLPSQDAPSESPSAPSEPLAAESPAESPPEPASTPSKPDEKVVESAPFTDPVALSGEAAAIVDSNADLRLTIFADVIRDHPLGERVASLLRRTPQWRDFFGPSAIDPIADVDRVLLAGPDFRDSSEVVAVVQHHLPPKRIEQAMETMVLRDGKWLDRKARLALARADRATRLFAAPNDHVVVVAPPQLEKQVRALGEKTRFPNTDDAVALSAYIVKPHYAAKGTGVVLPKTLRWARLDLRPRADGGGVLQILAQETSAEAANETAALVQALIDQATSLDLRKGGAWGGVASFLMGASKVKMLESVHFEARGDQVHGTLVATKNQLLTLADLLGAYLPPDPQALPPGQASQGGRLSGTSPTSSPVAPVGTAERKPSLLSDRKTTRQGSARTSEQSRAAPPAVDAPSGTAPEPLSDPLPKAPSPAPRPPSR